jgi:hypothetical protein
VIRAAQPLLSAGQVRQERHLQINDSNPASFRSALAHRSGSAVTIEPEALLSGALVVESPWDPT